MSVECDRVNIKKYAGHLLASFFFAETKCYDFLFNQTEYTVRRRISSLVEAGKRQNIGRRALALYIPCPGYFGK